MIAESIQEVSDVLVSKLWWRISKLMDHVCGRCFMVFVANIPQTSVHWRKPHYKITKIEATYALHESYTFSKQVYQHIVFYLTTLECGIEASWMPPALIGYLLSISWLSLSLWPCSLELGLILYMSKAALLEEDSQLDIAVQILGPLFCGWLGQVLFLGLQFQLGRLVIQRL